MNQPMLSVADAIRAGLPRHILQDAMDAGDLPYIDVSRPGAERRALRFEQRDIDHLKDLLRERSKQTNAA